MTEPHRRRPRRSRRNSRRFWSDTPQTVAADGTAAWTPVDAAIVLAVLVAGIVLKELALGVAGGRSDAG